MIIKHILKFFVLGVVVALPFCLVTISSNYKIVSKKDDQLLNSVNHSSLALSFVELKRLSLLVNSEIFLGDIYLADTIYSKVNKTNPNIYQTRSFQSEDGLSSNLLISDLSTLDFGLYQNGLIASDKNIYISIDEQGDIDKEIVFISNELNELNKQLEKELLVSSNHDLQNGDKNIYVSVDEQGNIDQERTVAESSIEEQLAVIESYKEPLSNQDTVTDKVLISIENIDGKIVQTVVSRDIGNGAETVVSPNSYRDIAINERDIYSSLSEIDSNDKVAEKVVIKGTYKEKLADKKSVLETAFAKIDTVDNIDIETVESAESIDVVQTVDQAKTTKIAKTTKPVESVKVEETVDQAKTTKVAKTTKPVERELVVSSDAEILGNDIELYSKTDMLDTTTIEMIAYSNYSTEDKNIENNVTVEEVMTNVASAEVSTEAKAKELQIAEIKAKAEKLQLALAEAEAKKIQLSEARQIEAREYEEGLINLASAGNITKEFASLSPSLVNRSLSIDLSIGREDIETPAEVKGVNNVNADIVLTDSLIEQKKKIEVIVVDRRNIDIKDEQYYYSKKSISTIPSTVLDSTVTSVKMEKFRIVELVRGFKSSGFISRLYSSRQCK